MHIGKTCTSIILACIALVVWAAEAAAHNVTVFAWVDGDTVHVESKYSGGRRPKGAPIEVYDGAGNLLLKGETDDNGEFSFPAAGKTELRIVLLAGMGHKAEWVVPAEDLQGIAAVPAAKAPAGEALQQEPQQAAPPVASAAPGAPAAADIEATVEKVLDRKLKPVLKMLAESRQAGPQLRDIVGGIGYIVGLVGLAAYLRYRRTTK